MAMLRATTSAFAAPMGRLAVRFSHAAPAAEPKKTPLFKLHEELGGKVVDFCGWYLPVQYKGGVIAETFACRQKAVVFDVSHMGQVRITGKDRVEALERLTVADVKALPVSKATLSVFTNVYGGIRDDTIFTKYEDHIAMVVNAACTDKDIGHMQEKFAEMRAKGMDVDLKIVSDHALVALQGPKAATVLQRFMKEDLTKVPFMSGLYAKVDGIPCLVTRCGYTGEDGFEIAIPAAKSIAMTKKLLKEPEVSPAGLGSRDALRLEAGLNLYGNDIDDSTTPIEAQLLWLIGKRRREEGGFLGARYVLRHLKEGVARKKVGFLVEGAPAREHTELYHNGEVVGMLSSGSYSPILKRPIGIGYVPTELATEGTKFTVHVRGKPQTATVSKMPFVPNGYYRMPAPKKN